MSEEWDKLCQEFGKKEIMPEGISLKLPALVAKIGLDELKEEIQFALEANNLNNVNETLGKVVQKIIHAKRELITDMKMAPLKEEKKAKEQIMIEEPQNGKSTEDEIKIRERKMKDVVIERLNFHISEKVVSRNLRFEVEPDICDQGKRKYPNYLNSTYEERIKSMNHRYNFMYKEFCKTVAIKSPDGSSGTTVYREIQPSTDSLLYFGRIVIDPGLVEKSVDGSGIFLELEKESKKELFSLDLAPVKNFFVFPSQFVVVKASLQAHSNSLVVSDILWETVQPASEKDASPMKAEFALSMKVASIMVFVGPYNLKGSSNYVILDEIVKTIKSKEPSLAILVGPFFDREEPSIGHLFREDAQEDFLKDKIEAPLSGLTTKVLLVPTLEDASCRCPFPLPASSHSEAASNVFYVGNPAKFTVNNLNVSVVGCDVVRDLVRSSCAKGEPSAKKVALCAQALIHQKSAYPLVPAKSRVDTTKMSILNLDPVPHILIVPSPLPVKPQMVGNTVLVNPGRASLMNTSNTYSEILIEEAKTVNPTPNVSQFEKTLIFCFLGSRSVRAFKWIF